MYWYVLSTVVTDVVVQKHQVISTYDADEIFTVLDQFYTKLWWKKN